MVLVDNLEYDPGRSSRVQYEKKRFFSTFPYIRIPSFNGGMTVWTLNVSERTMLAKVNVDLVNQQPLSTIVGTLFTLVLTHLLVVFLIGKRVDYVIENSVIVVYINL